MAEELEKVGDEKLVRETERLLDYLEEEENKKKKARASEGSGDGKPSACKPSASSSGPAAAEVPRSRGGAPMAMDSGDSVPETAKTKIGNSET